MRAQDLVLERKQSVDEHDAFDMEYRGDAT